MQSTLTTKSIKGATPIVPLTPDDLKAWLKNAEPAAKRWVEASDFEAKPDTHCLIPGQDGKMAKVLSGIRDPGDPFCLARLTTALPRGSYYISAEWDTPVMERATLGWALGGYRFTRYKRADQELARLVVNDGCDAKRIQDLVEAVFLIRDLINTPAEDMMPEHLAYAVKDLAAEFDAVVSETVGDALIEENYPAIHAVGRASVHEPRLIDLRWGNPDRPKVTLVGKGVCFDTGGLDLKGANNMRLMKKDMGGAAHAIALARLVMSAGLPVCLRLLVPAVDNAVSGSAFRPGDVLATRKGLTVEVDNTDAEGRLILCDALAEGASEAPDLMIDFATLTGAARVALGTDVPAMFCNNDALAENLLRASEEIHDPVWRLPLYAPYKELIESTVADIVNSASRPFGGAITAALFLDAFVPAAIPWAHFDLMAWSIKSRPGHPEGGDAMGLRAVFEYLCNRYDHA
ncbi:MAG: leucyl aminopeptidase family protein [Gammaproteobacteria bacterium]|nr:leucyl aminopeptidase family protein [Gammaproteobacteria bacterium]MDH3411336.1 leucyl aminopeptidase family protein [Gammaproteobacteria bacterium]